MIITIDPSINETGWAVKLASGDIVSGVIRVPSNQPKEMRLHQLSVHVLNLLKTHIGVTKMVLEVPPTHNYTRATGYSGKDVNRAAMYALCEAIGTIRCVAGMEGVAVDEITATQWKGKTNKGYALAFAKQVTGREIKNHNEADAVCLLEWYNGRQP